MSATDVTFVLPEEERYSAAGGAIATVTRELVTALQRQGASTSVISPRSHSPIPYAAARVDWLSRTGDLSVARRTWYAVSARVRRAHSPWRSRYLREVEQVLTDTNPDAVVVANDPQLAGLLARHHSGRTVVLWLHNYLVGAPARALRDLPATVRIVAVSDAVRRWTAEQHELDPARISVIHNGVDTTRFHPGPSERAPGPMRVVCHGRIDPNKGFLVAAEAVAALRAAGRTDISLTIIGGRRTFGYDESAVDDYMRALEDAVGRARGTFTGWIPAQDVPEALRAFDVACVLPLVPDPFLMAGLEAMASGCAVVAVPLGGVAEWVGDAAIIVEPDAMSVAHALEALATDQDMLDAAKEAATAQAARFTWDVAAGALTALLRHDPGTIVEPT